MLVDLKCVRTNLFHLRNAKTLETTQFSIPQMVRLSTIQNKLSYKTNPQPHLLNPVAEGKEVRRRWARKTHGIFIILYENGTPPPATPKMMH